MNNEITLQVRAMTPPRFIGDSKTFFSLWCIHEHPTNRRHDFKITLEFDLEVVPAAKELAQGGLITVTGKIGEYQSQETGAHGLTLTVEEIVEHVPSRKTKQGAPSPQPAR